MSDERTNRLDDDLPTPRPLLPGDFVTTDSGTGIVHLAPAFGEEDMELSTANGIEVVQPLDAGGRFTSQVPPYEGLNVFDANPVIIKDLTNASNCAVAPTTPGAGCRGGSAISAFRPRNSTGTSPGTSAPRRCT